MTEFQACQCCNAQLTKTEVALKLDKCAFCDNHAHVLHNSNLQETSDKTSCGLQSPAS